MTEEELNAARWRAAKAPSDLALAAVTGALVGLGTGLIAAFSSTIRPSKIDEYEATHELAGVSAVAGLLGAPVVYGSVKYRAKLAREQALLAEYDQGVV